MSLSFFAERFEEAGSEATDDQEFAIIDRVVLVFARLGDDPGIESKQGRRSPHIALQRFGHQRLDQRALLGDAAWLATFAHRDLLAEFGGEIGPQIETASRAALWV